MSLDQEIQLIILGALLGIVPAVLVKIIYDSIVNGFKKKSITKAIISELKEIKFQYVLNIFLIYSRHELLTRENIKWIYNNLKECSEIEEARNIIKGLHGFDKFSDQELEQYKLARKEASLGRSLNPKKTKILFVEQNIEYLDLFDPEYQYKAIRILRGVDRQNQQLDSASIYHIKTFEVEDADNHAKVCKNQDIAIIKFGEWSEILVNHINNFIQEYEDLTFKFNRN